jgi:hypothetical protein
MPILAGRKARASDFPNTLVQVIQTTTQAVATATRTAITFTTETVDLINGHNSVSNTSRYTPLIAGWYRCTGQVAFVNDTTIHGIGSQFRKNGAQTDNAPENYNLTMSSLTHANTALCHGLFSMNGTTDYIEIYGWHDRGSNLQTYYSAGFSFSFMEIEWVAPL